MSGQRKTAILVVAAVVFLALLAVLLCMSGSRVDYVPALMVDETLYLSTHEPISEGVEEGAVLGYSTSYTEKIPKKNGQTNISRSEVAYAAHEDGLAVLVNGQWVLFRPQSPKA